MPKVSPIAEFLTTNKAIPKRNGNVWRFYTKEGLYIGRQVQIQQNGATAYIREIFGEGLKTLFYECKLLAQKCTYYIDKNSPVGMNIAVTDSIVQTHAINYLDNSFNFNQKETKLLNQRYVVAIDENTGVGIYNINKPFVYRTAITSKKESTIKRRDRIKHTLN